MPRNKNSQKARVKKTKPNQSRMPRVIEIVRSPKRKPMPQVRKSGTTTVVAHREYVQDIITGLKPSGSSYTAFNAAVALPVNPGNSNLFPWLSNIAANFTQYRFRKLSFEYRSLSANALNSTNTALGSVIMSMNYDVLSPIFNVKQTQENYEYARSSKPSASFNIQGMTKQHQTSVDLLYVATAATSTQGDLRLYDLGNLQVSTVGMQAASILIGELWVTYEVELLKPQIPIGGDSAFVASDHFQGFVSNPTNLFGNTTITANPSSNLGCTVGLNAIHFPTNVGSGVYHILVQLTQNTAQAGSAPNFTLTSCSIKNIYGQGTAQYVESPGAASSSVSSMLAVVVQITGPSAVIDFGNSIFSTIGTLTSTDCVITPLGFAQS